MPAPEVGFQGLALLHRQLSLHQVSLNGIGQVQPGIKARPHISDNDIPHRLTPLFRILLKVNPIPCFSEIAGWILSPALSSILL